MRRSTLSDRTSASISRTRAVRRGFVSGSRKPARETIVWSNFIVPPVPHHRHARPKSHVPDQARVLVLLRRAAGGGEAVAVPLRPEAVRQDRGPQRSQSALALRGVLDVLLAELLVESGQEAHQVRFIGR